MINKSSLLLIYTGGTIGMKQDPVSLTLKPFDFNQIIAEVPEINKYTLKVDSVTFDPLIDSSDIEKSVWVRIAEIILDKYDDYDGFIILHGTDTMSYSASVLSFMLKNLTKPVIFTGSQLPVGIPRTDGKENIISAVEIASAKDSEGHARVPEVCIYFNSFLMRGNRSVKVNADAFRAFKTPNLPPLAEAGITINYNDKIIWKPKDWESKVKIDTRLDTRVSILKMHPGITPAIVRAHLEDPSTRAVILETYGAGNAPSSEWFIDLVSKACQSGKIIVNVTQCLAGFVDMNIYETGKCLQKAGVVNGYDSTTEGTLGKLFHLMGQSDDNEWVKTRMEDNMRGEISR